MNLVRIAAFAAATLGLLCLQTVPYAAADTTVVVRSIHDLPNDSSYGLVHLSCDAAHKGEVGPNVSPLVTTGPGTAPLGTRSWALRPDNASDHVVAGPYEYQSSITSNVADHLQVFPQGTGTFDGFAYAAAFVDSTHVWWGYAPVTATGGSWQTITVPTSTQYDWREIDTTDNHTVATTNGREIASLVDNLFPPGADPDGYVGIGFGCAGDGDVYFDDAEFGPTGDVTTYDFEGETSMIAMSASKKTLTAGQKTVLSGALSQGDGTIYAHDTLTLQAKALGSSTWKTVGTATEDNENLPTHPARITVKPTQKTSYRWTWPGDDATDGSTSKVLTIKVHSAVTAHAPKKASKGATVRVTGQVLPKKKGQKVSLWRGNHRLDRSAVVREGRFVLVTKAASKGVLKLVVKVAKSKGNLAGRSKTLKITVH